MGPCPSCRPHPSHSVIPKSCHTFPSKQQRNHRRDHTRANEEILPAQNHRTDMRNQQRPRNRPQPLLYRRIPSDSFAAQDPGHDGAQNQVHADHEPEAHMEPVVGAVAAMEIKVLALHGCENSVGCGAHAGGEQKTADGVGCCEDEKQTCCYAAGTDANVHFEWVYLGL